MVYWFYTSVGSCQLQETFVQDEKNIRKNKKLLERERRTHTYRETYNYGRHLCLKLYVTITENKIGSTV